MPEWMDDGEDQEKTESSDDTTSATGSFDEHGRFQKKVGLSVLLTAFMYMLLGKLSP
ncbi:unnamed protein product [Cylicostephanus goldi]|uniref:Uncharacterized protein n=1 Tax=Cylicostephanus goldi TaxID=71465 RepID=A0A3P6T389_CYLGO|nr:unnamed protein product [Cylicostephanus goldi]